MKGSKDLVVFVLGSQGYLGCMGFLRKEFQSQQQTCTDKNRCKSEFSDFFLKTTRSKSAVDFIPNPEFI
jgi:hypothetical protein